MPIQRWIPGERRLSVLAPSVADMEIKLELVADADAALADLTERGIEASPVDDQPWGRFVYFADPDGNRWSLQQLPQWS